MSSTVGGFAELENDDTDKEKEHSTPVPPRKAPLQNNGHEDDCENQFSLNQPLEESSIHVLKSNKHQVVHTRIECGGDDHLHAATAEDGFFQGRNAIHQEVVVIEADHEGTRNELEEFYKHVCKRDREVLAWGTLCIPKILEA